MNELSKQSVNITKTENQAKTPAKPSTGQSSSRVQTHSLEQLAGSMIIQNYEDKIKAMNYTIAQQSKDLDKEIKLRIAIENENQRLKEELSKVGNQINRDPTLAD
jgi:hypothetical protein